MLILNQSQVVRLLQIQRHTLHGILLSRRCLGQSALHEPRSAENLRADEQDSCPGSVSLALRDGLVEANLATRLMWSLQRGTSIIPKSVTPSRISSNFCLDDWKLSEDSMSALDGIETRFKVVFDSWMPIKVFFGDDE